MQTEHFDALIVAVGCYSEPNVPALPGMDATPAFQMHCHNYRSPERFAGQTVLVVGASFSGAGCDDASERGRISPEARALTGLRAHHRTGFQATLSS